MDGAVAPHARLITVDLDAEGYLSVATTAAASPSTPTQTPRQVGAGGGRDRPPHSGGRSLEQGLLETSGGLHGVGVSVVNALSEASRSPSGATVSRWRQAFSRGHVLAPIQQVGPSKKRGTLIRFKPDEQIFGVGAPSSPPACST